MSEGVNELGNEGVSELGNEGMSELVNEGMIDLPLLPNPYDRPRQMVDRDIQFLRPAVENRDFGHGCSEPFYLRLFRAFRKEAKSLTS